MMSARDLPDDFEPMFQGHELLPSFTASHMVDGLIESFGPNAAEHARQMARFARATGELEIAEDYELVRKTILRRGV